MLNNKITVLSNDIILDSNIYKSLPNEPKVCRVGKRRIARISHNGQRTYLHRFILNAKNGQIIDHINGNPLDNRLSNLRFVTHAQNIKNRTTETNSNTGFKGIIKRHGLFHVSIGSDKKQYFLGVYDDIEIAKLAYNQKAIILHGEYARLHSTTASKVVKHNPNTVTGIRGVTRQKNGAYSVTKWNNKQKIYLGTYKTLEEAKIALNNLIN